MSYADVTWCCIGGTIAWAALYAWFIAWWTGGAVTLSGLVDEWCTADPLVAGAIGFLSGHLFAEMLTTGG